MLLDELEIKARLESPNNLMNRLKKAVEDKATPVLPRINDLIPDVDDQLNIGGAKRKALSVMAKALNKLDTEVESIDGVKLARIIETMNRVVTESSILGNAGVQVMIYAPKLADSSDFNVIDVSSRE